MIVGIGRRGRATAVLVALPRGVRRRPRACPTTTPPTPPPTQAHSPPPREESPFSGPDIFCAPSENRFASVPPNDPRLRDQPVTVAMLVPQGADVVGDDERSRDVRRRDQPVRWHRRPPVRPSGDRRDRRSCRRLPQRHSAHQSHDGRLTGRHSGAAVHHPRPADDPGHQIGRDERGPRRFERTPGGHRVRGRNRAGPARRPGGERAARRAHGRGRRPGAIPATRSSCRPPEPCWLRTRSAWSNRAAPVSCSSRRSMWRRSPC